MAYMVLPSGKSRMSTESIQPYILGTIIVLLLRINYQNHRRYHVDSLERLGGFIRRMVT